jgi:TPR repeat protein
MPRVIFICPYLKGNGQTAAQRQNYVKYIATREGVELVNDTKKLLPATWRQKKLIGDILKDFPDTAERFEYEDYRERPTRENASAFITAALEQNFPFIGKRENYVDYISHRPGAERVGTHGLFSTGDEPIVLDQVAKKAAEHPGNMWLPIISLRREDAARLGYDNAANWRTFLSSYANDMARGLKIEPERFHWYAAYHDEGHHPHVQMVCWSDDPREGFLTKDGIRDIKSGLATRLFRNELLHIYEQQTAYRDLLNRETQNEIEMLITRLEQGTLRSEPIENMMTLLVDKLRSHKGKKKYGYLSATTKDIVDRIVDELAKDGRVAEVYDKWCEMRLEVLRTYLKEPPHPGPLSQQKELKRIRNIVVEEAAKLTAGGFIFEPVQNENTEFPSLESPIGDAEDSMSMEQNDDVPTIGADDSGEGVHQHIVWSPRYKHAKEYLNGSESTARDPVAAFRLMTEEALTGNALALHDLGRMYADGIGCGIDTGKAYEWYAKALAAFIVAENEKPWKYSEYRIGKMYAAGLGAERDAEAAAGWFSLSAAEGYKYAQYSLAGLYLRGDGVVQDYTEAYSLFGKSAAQGFPYADNELAKMHRDGIGTRRNPEAAEVHFKHAFAGFLSLEAQSHDDKLQYRLGQMLEDGVAVEKDVSAAFYWYRQAAEAGNIHAQYRLARLTLADVSAPAEQTAKALEWLSESAANSNGTAAYVLGKFYRDGLHVPKDMARAVDLFEQAASNETGGYASFALGKLYLSSDEFPMDIHKAISWLTRSADLGNNYAQYALAMVYFKDEEIPKDVNMALPLLLQSAGAGNEHALYRLGRLYLAGEDVPKDIERAVEYLTYSAERGNQYAQYALGKLYLMDNEIQRDREIARYWLEQSAAQGNKYARFFLDHFDDFRDPSIFLAATRLLHHMGRVFRDNQPVHDRASGSDSRTRRREREKKVALGHAGDEHEQSQTMN